VVDANPAARRFAAGDATLIGEHAATLPWPTLARWIAADPADLDARAALDRRRSDHPLANDPRLASRVAELSGLLEAHPEHAGLREALVLALAELGDPDRGRALLDAWPADRRDARYDRLRGRWDLEYDGRPDRAVESFRRALDVLPHDAKTLYRLARALKALGRDDEADRAAESQGRLREAIEPVRLGRRIDGDLARLDDPAARRDLADLCASVGLGRLAEAWRRDADAPPVPARRAAESGLLPNLGPIRPGR
jgi:tetratricopeptide (TPR) repeat protein